MSKTALELTPQEWQSYHLTERKPQPSDSARWQRAWEISRGLAQHLREKFGAKRVVIFGSLLNLDEFDAYSDIYLAAWGIPAEQFYQAVSAVTGISEEFAVDLVDGDRCFPQLQTVLENEGVSV